jgi:hypothetical protein
VDPDNGSVGFPITSDTITITYNQHMTNEGGAGSVRWPGSYELINTSNSQAVDILNRIYDPITYNLDLRLNLSDKDWTPGTLYRLRIVGSIRNICGTPQGGDVVVTFTTAPLR